MSEHTRLNQNELCDYLYPIYNSEVSIGNTILRIDRKKWPKIDLVVIFANPIVSFKGDINLKNTISHIVLKQPQCSPLSFYVAQDQRQAIAGPGDVSPVRDELCADLQEMYDYEVSHGNTIERIERYSWDKVDLVVSFSRPLFSEKREKNMNRLVKYVNKDSHYPLETSYTAKEVRQAITGPNG